MSTSSSSSSSTTTFSSCNRFNISIDLPDPFNINLSSYAITNSMIGLVIISNTSLHMQVHMKVDIEDYSESD